MHFDTTTDVVLYALQYANDVGNQSTQSNVIVSTDCTFHSIFVFGIYPSSSIDAHKLSLCMRLERICGFRWVHINMYYILRLTNTMQFVCVRVCVCEQCVYTHTHMPNCLQILILVCSHGQSIRVRILCVAGSLRTSFCGTEANTIVNARTQWKKKFKIISSVLLAFLLFSLSRSRGLLLHEMNEISLTQSHAGTSSLSRCKIEE